MDYRHYHNRLKDLEKQLNLSTIKDVILFVTPTQNNYTKDGITFYSSLDEFITDSVTTNDVVIIDEWAL